MRDKDDKYIWKNLVENVKPIELGIITKTLHWVMDLKPTYTTRKSVAIFHADSYFHTQDRWDEVINWNAKYINKDHSSLYHGDEENRYFLYEHLEGGIKPGTIVKRIGDGWMLHEILEGDIWSNFNNSEDQIREMNDLGADLLEDSNLEKHGYVKLMATPDRARRTLRRLR